MHVFDDIRLLSWRAAIVMVFALCAPFAAQATCPLATDATAPIESRIDVLVAVIDDCDTAHRIDDDDALKVKALLIKLRADIAEVRRRHRGDLLDADRARFSARLSRILAAPELVAK